MEDIEKFRKIYGLKKVYRICSVDNRKESSAEHTWSAMMLADFLIDKFFIKVDKLKVFELLLYHDLVEIESGDFPLEPGTNREDKKRIEEEAAKKLSAELPKALSNKYISLFQEFEERETREAKFAKAIDALDAEIHEIDYKQDWEGWTKEFLLSKKEHLFKEFPELNKLFLDLADKLEKEGYFSQ